MRWCLWLSEGRYNAFNQSENWRSIIIVPLTTSTKQAKRGPTAIKIPKGEGGLKKEGTVSCHQLTTLDRKKFTRRIGKLSSFYMKQVEAGIKVALELV